MANNFKKLCDYGCGREAHYQFKNGKWCCSAHWSKCPKIRKERANKLKGKTYEEIHGYDKAIELKNLRSKRLIGKPGWSKNKTYEFIYGEEKAKKLKKNLSQKTKGKTYEEILGEEKAKELKRKQSSIRKGITWQQKFGKDKANQLRLKFSIRSKKTKGRTYEERYGKEKSERLKKHLRNERKNKTYEEIYGIDKSKKIKISISIKNKRSIKKIKKQYPFFSQIEETRYNPDKPGEKEIQVHCKNHNCKNSKEQGGWFTPTGRQIESRLNSIENHGVDLNYFYCLDECKNECPLFNLKSDPFKENVHSYTPSEYQTFRDYVLSRDNHICQYCGEPATDVHHERPQKLEPFFAVDPDYAWSCCEKCHYENGHKDECSTGNLANKSC